MRQLELVPGEYVARITPDGDILGWFKGWHAEEAAIGRAAETLLKIVRVPGTTVWVETADNAVIWERTSK